MSSLSDTLTRCPHCETRFRVTKKQLAAARGKVRCGHCLQVFNAIEHAQPEDAAPPEPETTEPLESPKPEPEKAEPEEPAEDEDLIFDDNPEEDAAEGRYAGHKHQPNEDEFNEALLAMERGENPDFYDAPEDDEEVLKGDDDESWAESLLKEDEPEQKKPEPEEDEYELPDPRPLESERNSLSGQPQPERMARRRPDPAAKQPDAPSEPTPESTASSEPVWANLDSSPVAPLRVERSTGGRRWLWGLAAVLAAGLLVYQLGWQHFEKLALYEPLRPWYASLCDMAGCELPPLQAVDKIKSRELVVRSHPDQDDALLLEVTILNEARFDQPYPAIALSFSNLNNDIVAQRVFQPTDYLGDRELASQSLPAGQGRRIRLALRDPGKDAINYRIDFLASQ